MDTGRKGGWGELGPWDSRTYRTDTVYKTDSEREPTAHLREPPSGLFGDLNGKEIQKKRKYV